MKDDSEFRIFDFRYRRWRFYALFAAPALLLRLLSPVPVCEAAENKDRIRMEERARQHGALRLGSRVTLGPIDKDNWSPDQNRYVGSTTKVVELVPDRDFRGCYGVRIAADGGVYFWRVRNLAGQGLRSGEYLDCIRLEGTEIPMCVISLGKNLPLRSKPSTDADIVGSVPMYEVVESQQTWYLPRQLFVHKRQNGFLLVMESDFGSREPLGWVAESDTVIWPTRQGYVINRARIPRNQIRGYDSLESWQAGSGIVYEENLDSVLTPDPNATSMCEGLLIKHEIHRGMDLIQCVITPSQSERRQVAWLPVKRNQDDFHAYVLMSKLDLIELSGSFALLYAACENGYADSIKQALEEDWDLQAKAMTGDKKRVIKYARFYREVQKIYPALSRRLALPPGESTEREFKEVGNRAELSVSKVQRQIDLMTRDERDWIWVKVSDL